MQSVRPDHQAWGRCDVGGGGGSRTLAHPLKRRPLCQLSYTPGARSDTAGEADPMLWGDDHRGVPVLARELAARGGVRGCLAPGPDGLAEEGTGSETHITQQADDGPERG